MFSHVSASRLRNVFCLKLFSVLSLIAKIISPVIFDPDHSFKRQNALCLTKKLFIEVYMVRRSCLVIFYFKEKFCVSPTSASRTCGMFVVSSVPKTLSKKLYLRLNLTQIIHSNSTLLYL